MPKPKTDSLIISLNSFANTCKTINDREDIEETSFNQLYDEIKLSFSKYNRNTKVLELKTIEKALPERIRFKPEKTGLDLLLNLSLFVLSPLLLLLAYFLPVILIPFTLIATGSIYGQRMRRAFLATQVNSSITRVGELFANAARIIRNVDSYDKELSKSG